jgi:hypothetical protein
MRVIALVLAASAISFFLLGLSLPPEGKFQGRVGEVTAEAPAHASVDILPEQGRL